ncbi:hypothetical protein C8C99_2116 [Acidovorax sp. 107]|nr:hypothetical protein C8C99_2116 [Acidovorax sp. 107]
MTEDRLVHAAYFKGPALRQALLGLLFLCPWGVICADTSPAAERHLHSARQHAKSSAQLQKNFRTWCASDLQDSRLIGGLKEALLQAEIKFKDARDSGQNNLESPVVERQCLAYRLTKVNPEFKTPVWYLSHLQFVHTKPTSGHGISAKAVARASSADGPILNNRITFSMGLHHSCFGYTDVKGQVACTLVDTHPHGPGVVHEEEADSIVASLQGVLSDDLVLWPTTLTLKISPHSGRSTGSTAKRP